MMFERPFFISPHALKRCREHFGLYEDDQVFPMLNIQMQHPEIPDAANTDVSRRGLALFYAVRIADTPATAVVTAPDHADMSILPRNPDVWPTIVTVYPGRKHIAKYRLYVEERRAMPAKPYENTWEEWEVETLRLMRWVGYTMAEMATLLKRTERQIERHVPIIQPRWTEDELQKACDMRSKGKTYREIGQKLGRSTQAVKGKMLRHRRWVLSNPDRAAFLRILYWLKDPQRILSFARKNRMISRLNEMVPPDDEGEEEEALSLPLHS